GTRLVPVDLLASMSSPRDEKDHHRILLANCIAQSEALMMGNIDENTQNASHYKFIAGNKPSTTILYESLTPATLGALLAMYEHRTYVQGCIWNINSFDQWGVELGKTIADSIANELKRQKISPSHDASTLKLIERYRDRHGD
ncbi:MAG: glucose-6-phosphate isomerase, partial [Gammaproteobacteria bacterium]|nr:glucose-6-phosphate isomerase [Gammaproteobacteria bacterium]